MALSRITQNAVTGASASIAADAGDLVIAFAYRASSVTIPSLPTDWTSIVTRDNTGGGTNGGGHYMYRVAPEGGMSGSITFTNAEYVSWIVLRGQKATSPIGGQANAGGNNSSNTIRYLAYALTGGETGQWLVGFCGRTTGDAIISSAPPGMTNHASNPATPLIGVHSTDAIRSTNWPQTDVTGAAGSAKYLSAVIEVLAAPDAPPPSGVISRRTGNPSIGRIGTRIHA